MIEGVEKAKEETGFEIEHLSESSSTSVSVSPVFPTFTSSTNAQRWYKEVEDAG
jgi:hypothetical protein